MIGRIDDEIARSARDLLDMAGVSFPMRCRPRRSTRSMMN